MKIKTTQQALDALRRADAAKLYESLEEWQQRELLCIVRRLVNAASAPARFPVRLVDPPRDM